MTSEADLAVVRRTYARQVADTAGVSDPRLVEAFATVRREDFLGAGPWTIMRPLGPARKTSNADPVYVYQDAPVALIQEKSLNNGQPSFLAMLIDLCAIREGDRVVHIGTGTGYYTALMSHLVGATGRLVGIEIEPELAREAADNLQNFAGMHLVEADGFAMPLEPADAILVNAGTSRFAAAWLDALEPGGRLVVPLAHSVKEIASTLTKGLIFLITRDADGYAARCVSGTSIYACQGAHDPAAEAALAKAIEGRRAGDVRRLRREPVAAERTWLAADGWSLTYD